MKRFAAGFAVLAIVIGATTFFGTLGQAVYYAPETEMPPPQALVAAAASVPEAVKPARLLIPALGIDANVQHVGINAKGAMMAPSNFTDAGWYKYGTVPGHVGSAVMDGHVDNGLKLAGVFKRLGELEKGDDIYVMDQNGRELRFVVEDVRTYPYDASPSEEIFGKTDAARLNLITCAGTWVKGERTYSERLVVYAKLASGE